jgi:hypothetical protein
MELILAWLQSLPREQIAIAIAVVFCLAFLIFHFITKHDKRRKKTKTHHDLGAHYYSNRWSTNPKHLADNKKHKLKPLPESLFRKSPPNPLVHNDNGDTILVHRLLNEKNSVASHLKVGCPVCDGTISKKRNFFNGVYFYGCSNSPDCKFETLDSSCIKPIKIISVFAEQESY